MNGNQMRIEFLQQTYIPYIKSDMLTFSQLTHAGILKKCEEYGVIVDNTRREGTEVLRNRLRYKAFQMKREAHKEIAELIEEELA